MPNRSKKTIIDLRAEIGHDFDKYADAFLRNIRALTPIDTGKARRGWKKTYRKQYEKGGVQKQYTVVENAVPYVQFLEQGHSKQAPDGMIDPAIKRTRRRR